MRTLYTMAPFRREELSYLGAGVGMGDILDDAEKLVVPLLKDLDDLIAKVPVEKAGPFKTRRDECLAESSVKKYACLYTLFQDIKDAVEGGSGGAAPPSSTPPPKSGFPWLWVGLAGAAVVGLVAVLATVARK